MTAVGLRDVLNGSVLAFNNVKMIPVQAYDALSSRFPEHDFVRDWFANVGMATLAFQQALYDLPERWDAGGVKVPNIYRVNIKKITPAGVMQIGKLIGMYMTTVFFENDDNVEFVTSLDISQETLENYLFDGMTFDSRDAEMYSVLKTAPDNAARSLVWTGAFYHHALGELSDPDIVVSIHFARLLATTYGFFIDLFHMRGT